MLLNEEASNFLLRDFKKENFQLAYALAAIWPESSPERLFTNGLMSVNKVAFLLANLNPDFAMEN